MSLLRLLGTSQEDQAKNKSKVQTEQRPHLGLILSRYSGCALQEDGLLVVLRHMANGLWEEKGAITSTEMSQ